MKELLEEFRARERVPGVVVGTFGSEGPREVAAAGVADVESGADLGADTLFRIYSLAKLMTAAAIVDLARCGTIDLDGTVAEQVPDTDTPERSRGSLTVRQALSHTAGMVPDSLTRVTFGRNDDDRVPEIMREYGRAFRFAAPGRHYGYNNAAFNLSAVLIEQATGIGFPEAMSELLFNRLGMTSSTHDPAMAMTFPQAQHHELVEGRPAVIHRVLVGSKWQPSSQCYSTLRDVVRFGVALLNDLRRHEEPDLARPVADLRLDVGTCYGLGCYLTPSRDGGTVVGHEGFFEGMWVKLAIDAVGNRGVVWMDNRGDELRDARYRIIEKLMPGLLPPVEGRTQPLAHAPAAHAADPHLVTGRYRRLGAPGFHVDRDGDEVVVTHEGRSRRMSRFGRGIWRCEATDADVGAWRPHAGSRHICLGLAEPDEDGTEVAHLNAIPYVRASAAA